MPSMTIDRPFPEKVRHANYLLSCKRCIGGTVILFKDGRKCINCGAEHDDNGNLIEPRKLEQPKEEGRSLFKLR